MDHIARHLGISKKTLYQWVPNKNELVIQFIRSFIEIDKQACCLAETNAKNALEELLLIRNTVMLEVELMKINILFDIEQYHKEAWDILKQHQKSFVAEIVTKNLKRGIEEGFFRCDIDIDLVSRLHGHQIFNLFDHDWFPRNKYTAPQIVAEFMKSYSYSIANEKGRKFLEKNWK